MYHHPCKEAIGYQQDNIEQVGFLHVLGEDKIDHNGEQQCLPNNDSRQDPKFFEYPFRNWIPFPGIMIRT